MWARRHLNQFLDIIQTNKQAYELFTEEAYKTGILQKHPMRNDSPTASKMSNVQMN